MSCASLAHSSPIRAMKSCAAGLSLAEVREVALGHLVLRREGEVVTLRDGLREKEIGRLDVPEGFEVAGFAPTGRLLVL